MADSYEVHIQKSLSKIDSDLERVQQEAQTARQEIGAGRLGSTGFHVGNAEKFSKKAGKGLMKLFAYVKKRRS